MRPVFDTLLAALSPTDAPGDLWEIRIAGESESLQRPWIPQERVLYADFPLDRGTLPPVFLALLQLLPRDSEAVVLVGRGDHGPAELLGAISRVVAQPGTIALLRPDAPTVAEGFAFVCEARVLYGLLRHASPAWTELLNEAAFDDDEIGTLARCLAPADLEPVIRLASLHVARSPERPRLVDPDRVGLA